MNTNTLVLGKYATPETLAAVLDRAARRPNDKTLVIVKAEDDAPFSPFVVRHLHHMQGDVCDALWEAAKLNADMPLLLASSRGYRFDFTLPCFPDDADIAVYCDEPTRAGFKYDDTGALIEAGAMPGNTLFRCYFRTTRLFIDLTENVILSGKTEGEGYALRTVLNQGILDGLKIVVTILGEEQS